MTQILAVILVAIIVAPILALIYLRRKYVKKQSPAQKRTEKKALIVIFALCILGKIISVIDHQLTYDARIAKVEHSDSAQKLDAAAEQVVRETTAGRGK